MEAENCRWFHPTIIAIDGPLLPVGADKRICRHVESVFIRAAFHNPNSDLVIVALDWS